MDLSFLVPIVVNLAEKFPIVMSILLFMAACRVIAKPLGTLIRHIIALTPTKKDDTLLIKLEKHKLWLGFVYFVDFLTSVKIESALRTRKQELAKKSA